mmetsp:Transcript_115782/g.327480  ORF Transcript_115782/g.327480 Transcript_115782/m.327480 type:complete len:261 (+) Transcript_115782:355-1137(+)
MSPKRSDDRRPRQPPPPGAPVQLLESPTSPPHSVATAQRVAVLLAHRGAVSPARSYWTVLRPGFRCWAFLRPSCSRRRCLLAVAATPPNLVAAMERLWLETTRTRRKRTQMTSDRTSAASRAVSRRPRVQMVPKLRTLGKGLQQVTMLAACGILISHRLDLRTISTALATDVASTRRAGASTASIASIAITTMRRGSEKTKRRARQRSTCSRSQSRTRLQSCFPPLLKVPFRYRLMCHSLVLVVCLHISKGTFQWALATP